LPRTLIDFKTIETEIGGLESLDWYAGRTLGSYKLKGEAVTIYVEGTRIMRPYFADTGVFDGRLGQLRRTVATIE